MGKTRAPYPAAFRQQMVELVESGRSPADLAREFDAAMRKFFMSPPITEYVLPRLQGDFQSTALWPNGRRSAKKHGKTHCSQ